MRESAIQKPKGTNKKDKPPLSVGSLGQQERWNKPIFRQVTEVEDHHSLGRKAISKAGGNDVPRRR